MDYKNFICRSCCEKANFVIVGDKIISSCPDHPPIIIEADGKYRTLEPNEIVYY